MEKETPVTPTNRVAHAAARLRRLPDLNDDQAYNIDEACAYLGISRVTGYAFVRDGKLSTYKIGRHRRVRGSAIRDCIAALSDPSKSSPRQA